MAQLRQDYPELVKREVEVIVVGPEAPDRFREYWQRYALPFLGLPDPRHAVLKLYGQEVNLFKLGRLPAAVLVDKNGTVRLAHYGHSMRDIPRTEDVIGVLA